VDLGAYEVQPDVTGEFIGWLAAHGLATDGSADDVDIDADGHSARQEWRADTDPTSATSSLRLLAPTHSPGGINIRWSSVSSRSYFLERAVDLGLASAFVLIETNIPGMPGETSFIDTNAVGTPYSLYRVGVQ
jgi:hypothetical protein